jgi:hypothetical protein
MTDTAAPNPDLSALLAEWQPALRLQHWLINVRYERHLGSQGRVSYNLRSRTAVIRIIDPLDYEHENPNFPQDVERTLVHELLHLHFAPLQTRDKSPEDLAEDQAVDALARSFVDLKRRLAVPAVQAA